MAPASTISDTLERWGNVSFSDREVPLGDVVESLRMNEDRFVLKKSKKYSNNLVVSSFATLC